MPQMQQSMGVDQKIQHETLIFFIFFAPYFSHINGDRSEANWYWTSMHSGWDTLATMWKRTRSQKPRCLSVVDSLWSEVGAKLYAQPLNSFRVAGILCFGGTSSHYGIENSRGRSLGIEPALAHRSVEVSELSRRSVRWPWLKTET